MPDIEKGEKIRIRFVENGVHLICLTLFLRGPFAHIHDAQSRHDDKHLPQHLPLTRFQQHTPQARIKRQTRQTPAYLGKVALTGVQGSNLLQRAKTLRNRPRRGWIEKGELPHIAKAQSLHSQDHSRK